MQSEHELGKLLMYANHHEKHRKAHFERNERLPVWQPANRKIGICSIEEQKAKLLLIGSGMLAMMANAAAPTTLEIGDPLRELKGEFLMGRAAVLPTAASGKVALLLIGFSYDSRFQVEAWAKRFRKDFDKNPQVTFYEVPMIGGMARMGKWFIDSGMHKGTPKADQENVITVYGGVDPWKQRLGFKDSKDAYLVVLDKSGKVAWKHIGPLDEAVYKTMRT